MFTSRFTESEKQDIVNDRITNRMTVRAVCEKYNITAQTFYTWQRRISCIDQSSLNRFPEIEDQSPEDENKILRRLYIDLSAHNYQLAKFLEK